VEACAGCGAQKNRGDRRLGAAASYGRVRWLARVDTRVPILAVQNAEARGRSRGVPPFKDAPRPVSRRHHEHKSKTHEVTEIYFIEIRRRRGRKSDAEPIDW
jgi:hypothetical protein